MHDPKTKRGKYYTDLLQWMVTFNHWTRQNKQGKVIEGYIIHRYKPKGRVLFFSFIRNIIFDVLLLLICYTNSKINTILWT